MQPQQSQDDFLSIQDIANEIRERVRARFGDPVESSPPQPPRSPATAARAKEPQREKHDGLSGTPLVFTQELVNLTRGGQLLVGRMPPQPPTLRARVGAVFVQIVRRLLFWYTPQVQDFQRAVANAAAEQRDAIQELRLVAKSSREQLRTEQQERESLTAGMEERLRAEVDSRERLAGRLGEQLRSEIAAREHLAHRFEKQIGLDTTARESTSARFEKQLRAEAAIRDAFADQFREQLRAEADAREGLAERFREQLSSEAAMRGSLAEQLRAEAEARESVEIRLSEQLSAEIAARESLAQRFNEQLQAEVMAREALAFRVESLVEELAKMASAIQSGEVGAPKTMAVEALVEETRREVAIQKRRISMMIEEVRKQRDTAKSDGAPPPHIDRSNVSPVLYLDFENAFRGSRKDIKNRLKIYLPRLQDAGIAGPAMPVLDLGCGRGEWIEILMENTIHVSGVDSNSAMVEECRKRGFTVFEEDSIEFLRRLPAESQGCVTAFHLIEHLQFERLVSMIDEIVRVLKPGGLAILETPNPENLLVGACTFYYDPTHVRPLPRELMQFLLEARGLCAVESLPLHPNQQAGHLAGHDGPAVELLKQYLYGPRDYAVIGRKA